MGVVGRSRSVLLNGEADVYLARETAAVLAAEVGFDRYERSNVETAVSELCMNVIRHGGGRGRATFRTDEQGFEAEVSDRGPDPPVRPVRKRGLGIGLMGAEWLMDELHIERLHPGTRVTIRKRFREPVVDLAGSWVVQVAARAKRGESELGDGHAARTDSGESLLSAVVDGLGSGSGAADAAGAVLDAVTRYPEAALDTLVQLADEAAEQTRGAVGLIARISPRRRRLEYVGVGDVAGMVFPTGETLHIGRGRFGMGLPQQLIETTEWNEQSMLVLWTDGLKFPGRIPPPPPSATEELSGWAEEMVLEHGVDHDDGLILVARAEAGSGR